MVLRTVGEIPLLPGLIPGTDIFYSDVVRLLINFYFLRSATENRPRVFVDVIFFPFPFFFLKDALIQYD